MLHTARQYDAVVIGAGISGLTAAAVLAKRDMRVLLLERHNVVGGCASFYQRGGYRFDVGATLVGGFGRRGVHRLLNARLGIEVSSVAVEPAMVIHLPDTTVVRYGDERWQAERLRAFGPQAEAFWRAQERIAERAWDLSSRFPDVPFDTVGIGAFAGALRPRDLPLAATLGKTVASIMPRDAGDRLRAFVDAQLLITAQTGAREADLAYGSTALDLAREGTYHLADGVSTIAETLARALRAAGGEVRYRASAAEIETDANRAVTGIRLEGGEIVRARRVVAALPIDAVARLCPPLERRLRPRLAALPQRWGAFAVYCGLPAGVVPPELPAHHQFVARYGEPLGEGATVFASFSDEGAVRRARGGGRAVTLSTHTDVARWERAYRDGVLGDLRRDFTGRLLAALERIVPGASERAEIVEAADPHTFERYTGRARGLVGGLPQTPFRATLGAFGHATGIAGLFLCGDTAFPGQSTVGATLSGYNAARAASQFSLSSKLARNFASSMM